MPKKVGLLCEELDDIIDGAAPSHTRALNARLFPAGCLGLGYVSTGETSGSAMRRQPELTGTHHRLQSSPNRENGRQRGCRLPWSTRSEELHQPLAVGRAPAGNGIVSGAGLKPSHRSRCIVALRDIGAGYGTERLSVRLGRRLIK